MEVYLGLVGWEHLLLVFCCGNFIGLLHDDAVSLFYNLPVHVWDYFFTLLNQYDLGHLLVLLI